jgi:hypothetical protein
MAPHTTTLANVSLPQLEYTGFAFMCDPPLPDRHGPLHVNTENRRLLQFEDGTSYIGLGPNIVGQRHGNNPTPALQWWDFYRFDFDLMMRTLEQLHDVGGNFARVILEGQTFGPEWVNLGVYDHYFARYACAPGWGDDYRGNGQYQCWAFEQLLEHAHSNDIYFQLCMDPKTPNIASEAYGWGNHPYVEHYVEPSRDTATGMFDVKAFFYAHGDTAVKDQGPFYYWKRRYKYMMARWGYSVNLAIIEPFNEIDNILTFSSGITPDHMMCDENKFTWQADPQLRTTINQWFTDMSSYVRDPANMDDPAGSPLGEERPFLVSYAASDPWMANADDYYVTFSNPKVDLMDAHMYTWPSLAEQDHPDYRMQACSTLCRNSERTFHHRTPRQRPESHSPPVRPTIAPMSP